MRWCSGPARWQLYIKQLDGNHLVADGGEGFDDDASSYPGMSSFYPVRGSRRLQLSPASAACGLRHGELSLISCRVENQRRQRYGDLHRRHEEIARNARQGGLHFGEYGKRAADQSQAIATLAPGRAFDAQRAQVYQAWLGYSAIEQATSGAMVWQLINDGKDDCEGFQVYCPLDAQSCDVLRQVSDPNLPPRRWRCRRPLTSL